MHDKSPAMTEMLGDICILSFNNTHSDDYSQQAIVDFFHREFTQFSNQYHYLLIDLHGVETLDSSCLSAIMEVHMRAQKNNGHLAVCHVHSPRLLEILTITCSDKVLNCYPTRALALEAMQTKA